MEFRAKTKEIIEWFYCIAIAIVLALLFRYYIGTPTIVMHESMYPTLHQNERLWINRFVRTAKQELNYGDIVTFEAPDVDPVNYIEMQDKSNPVAYYNSYEGFEAFKHNFLEIGKTSYIKRLIGKPGDRIEIKNDKVYRNGQVIDEWYLPSGTVTRVEAGVYSDIIVPEGTYFFMGDNRSGSYDSRAFGCIPFEKVESRVVARIWPLNKFGKIDDNRE